MFDRPKFALKDEEEMEDFHDYEDEEHSEPGSKLDDYSDAEDEDDEDEEEVIARYASLRLQHLSRLPLSSLLKS